MGRHRNEEVSVGKTLSAETLKLLDQADAILAKALDEVRAKLRNAPDDLPNGFCSRCDCESFVLGPGGTGWKCRQAGCGHSMIFHGIVD
jgi:hypothetical protein